MEAIQRFKYNSETQLTPSLGALFSSSAIELIPNPRDFLTIPVPLHRRRLRERGFNQSLLLAKALSSYLGTQLDYLCLTRKGTQEPRQVWGKKKGERTLRMPFPSYILIS
jgi:predicted amidophosphoribosyltransferase